MDSIFFMVSRNFEDNKKSQSNIDWLLLSSGDWTRTSDLWVMSPTSYLLLYPAIWSANNNSD